MSPGRAWPRPTSRVPQHSSVSVTRAGRSRRSSPRSSRPGSTRRTAAIVRSGRSFRVVASSRSSGPTGRSSSPSRARVSFGLLSGRGFALEQSVALSDAGGGAGTWEANVELLRTTPGTELALATSTVSVPGELAYEIRVADNPRAGDIAGYLLLRRGTELRRIPFWGRVSVAALDRHRATTLAKTGVHRGTTAGRPSLVSRYRYPEDPSGIGVTTMLRGPEAVYRVLITQTSRELRRRRHEPGTRDSHRAARRRRPRRESAHRVRRAPRRAQPVSRELPGAGPRCRRVVTASGRVRGRVRQRGDGRCRTLHLPLLDRRRHAAHPAPPHEGRDQRAAHPRRGDRCGLGRVPGLHRRQDRRRDRVSEIPAAVWSAFAAATCLRAGIASG